MTEESNNAEQSTTPFENKIHKVEVVENSKWVTISSLIVSIATLILVGVQSCIMKGQLNEMESSSKSSDEAASTQAKIMQGQLDEMKSSSKAADGQAKIMQGQLDEMKTASKLTQKTLNLLVVDQRPWVSVDVQTIAPLTFDSKNNGSIGVRFTLKNTGRSPATQIEIFPRLYLLGGDPAKQKLNPTEEQLSYCEKFRKHKNPKERSTSLFGFRLSPGDTITKDYYLGISADAIFDYQSYFDKASSQKSSSTWIQPILIGCVDYGMPFNDEHHQTGFIRKFIHSMPSLTNGVSENFEVKEGSIPLNDLRLIQPAAWGDGFIN